MINAERLDTLLSNVYCDSDALEEIYLGMKSDVFAVAFAVMGNRDLAEEAVSETFVRIYSLSKDYHPGGKGRAFILKVCRNVAKEQLRSANKQLYLDELPESAENHDNDNCIFIKDLLLQLKPKEREIIILRYYNDLTEKEIARILDIPLGTVKWRHSATIKKLKGIMERGA